MGLIPGQGTNRLPRLLRGKDCLQCRRPGFDPWVGKIPWRRKCQPALVFLPGESHGQRSLVGYSPWGHKDSDTTEQLSVHTHTQGTKTPTCCVGWPKKVNRQKKGEARAGISKEAGVIHVSWEGGELGSCWSAVLSVCVLAPL